MRCCLINKITVLIILFSGALFSFCDAQNKTALQGQINKSDGTALGKEKVILMLTEQKLLNTDTAVTDTNGIFLFENFPAGDYSLWLEIQGIDNSAADIISINKLNPEKRNQHFKIDDGSLVNIESNYSNIKEALENRENVYVLNLNSLQHDVAEKSIVIRNDGSRKLSPKIGEFINLESLSININQINSMPAEMGELGKLTVLNANLNKFTVLPAEMENLRNLRELDLGKNLFAVFPEVITKYSMLEVLSFEDNPITALPATINTLKNLKVLNLSNCSELPELPVQIGELSNLETLDISRCVKLKTLPEEFYKLKNLKVLDVTGTKISTKRFQEAVPGCEVRK